MLYFLVYYVIVPSVLTVFFLNSKGFREENNRYTKSIGVLVLLFIGEFGVKFIATTWRYLFSFPDVPAGTILNTIYIFITSIAMALSHGSVIGFVFAILIETAILYLVVSGIINYLNGDTELFGMRDIFEAVSRWAEERQLSENAVTNLSPAHFQGLYWVSFFIDLPSASIRALLFVLFIMLPSAIVLFAVMAIFDANSLTQLFTMNPATVQGGVGFRFMQWILWAMFRIGVFLAYLPILMSLLSLAGVTSGGMFTRWALGARVPSMRERERYSEALDYIAQIAPRRGKTGIHSSWWVIDNNFPRTYTIGTTLYVTTEALKDSHFTAMLAHEIGHYERRDGLRVKSLRNFVYPIAQHVFTVHKDLGQERGVILTGSQVKQAVTINPSPDFARMAINQIVRLLYPLLFGGLGVYLLSPLWARYFRMADYLADDFVVECGLGDDLREHLEEWAIVDHAVPFWDSWTPYTELRLDRLRTHLGE